MDHPDKDNSRSPPPSESSSHIFVNITHPEQAKNKDFLKTVRRVAMQSYLNQSGSGDLSETQIDRLSSAQGTVLDKSVEAQLTPRRDRRATSPSEDDHEASSSTSGIEDAKMMPGGSRRSSRSTTTTGGRRKGLKLTPEISSSSGRYGISDSGGSHLRLLRYNWNIFFGSKELENSWQRMGSEDPLFNYSAICISARQTDALNQTLNNPSTVTISNEIVNGLNQRLQQPSQRTSDMTIAITVHICFSELYAPTSEVDWCDFLRQLIEARGGVRMLDYSFSGLSQIVLIVSLLSAVMYEFAPHQLFHDAAIESSLDPNYGQGLESPLCHPDGTFSPGITNADIPQNLIELLQCVSQAIDVAGCRFVDSMTRWHQYQQQKQHVREKLLTFKAMPKTRTKGVEKELAHIFEACRLAFVIMERALFYSQPLSEAVTGAHEELDLLYRLQTELAQTHLDLCWAELAGVLLWVSLVGAAAANGIQKRGEETTKLRAYLVGCAVRTTLKYTFKYPGELLTALSTFRRVQEVCAQVSAC